MPSVIIGNQSGGQNLLSGLLWSGTKPMPVGGVQLRLDRSASGNVYVGLSGGVTVTSGGFALSGGGLLDGMQVGPGDALFLPRLGIGPSGLPQVYVAGDATVSGQGRVYWEAF